ncbi:MAG: hypothetical protein ACE5KA_01145 [Nitrososphaerales archaeon]
MSDSYTDLVDIMGGNEVKINEVLRFIIENSLITESQLEIISKRRRGERGARNRSRGAYYRVLDQSRRKIRGILYSFVLMELIGLLDENGKTVLERLAKQVAVTQGSDIDEGIARDVIQVMDEVVRRLSKV